MEYTNKLRLYLPEDHSEQWGYYLNQNFEKLDQKIIDTITVATEQFINSGIYGTINLDELVNTEDVLTLPTFNCFFSTYQQDYSLSTLPGTYVQGSLTYLPDEFNLNGKLYDSFYIGLTFDGTLVQPVIRNNYEDFDTVSGADIYLCNVVVYSIGGGVQKFANNLFTLKPWYSNFSANDRVIDISTHGSLTGGAISYERNGYLTPKSKIRWVHEGINPSSEVSPHFKDDFTMMDTENHILFFRACTDERVSTDELVLNTQLDTNQYCDSETKQLKAVPQNYYTIQRYAVLENGTSVVFYGDKTYGTLAEAENAMPFLNDISTFVLCRELARIIVKQGTYDEVKIFNLEEMNETGNLSYFDQDIFSLYNRPRNSSIRFHALSGNHILEVDPLKNQYMIADAAENRSTGIIPGTSASIQWDGTNLNYDFTAAFVDCHINDHMRSKVEYRHISGSFTPKISEKGWFKIIFTDATPYVVGIDDVLDTGNQFVVAYLHYNNGIDLFTIRPQVMYSTNEEKILNELSPIQISGGVPANLDTGIFIQEATVKSEGVNYSSSTNYNLATYGENEAITWQYINDQQSTLAEAGNTFVTTKIVTEDGTEQTVSSGYTIQKLLMRPDNKFLMVYGRKTYDSEDAALAAIMSSEEQYDIPLDIALELARFVVPVAGVSHNCKVVYTNEKILGTVNITTLNRSQLPTTFKESQFAVYQDTNASNQVVFNLTGLSGVATIKIPAAGTYYLDGIGQHPLDIPASKDSNFFIGWDAENNKFVVKQPTVSNINGLQTELSNLQSQITNLTSQLNSFKTEVSGNYVKYKVSSSQPTNGEGTIWYQTSGSNRLIRIWNGSKWEIMNTWQ